MDLYFIQWDIRHFNQYLTFKCPKFVQWNLFQTGLYSFSTPPAFLQLFLTLWCSKRFQAFLKKVSLLYFSREWSLETKISGLGIFSAADGPLLLGPSSESLGNRYVQEYVCTHTHICQTYQTHRYPYLYTHACTCVQTYYLYKDLYFCVCVYIYIYWFILISLVPIQHYRVHSAHPSFHVCNSFSNKEKPSFHYAQYSYTFVQARVYGIQVLNF